MSNLQHLQRVPLPTGGRQRWQPPPPDGKRQGARSDRFGPQWKPTCTSGQTHRGVACQLSSALKSALKPSNREADPLRCKGSRQGKKGLTSRMSLVRNRHRPSPITQPQTGQRPAGTRRLAIRARGQHGVARSTRQAPCSARKQRAAGCRTGDSQDWKMRPLRAGEFSLLHQREQRVSGVGPTHPFWIGAWKTAHS